MIFTDISLVSLLDITPYDWSSILTSLFCGTIIGIERQLRGKPVGIRTSTLIIMGTYIFVASALLFKSELLDPSRVIGQVITGIGFLGAGVMLARDGAVVGVTSAATIWALAAIGIIISIGHLAPAMKLSMVVVSILYGVDLLENKTVVFSRGVHTKVKSLKSRKYDSPEQ